MCGVRRYKHVRCNAWKGTNDIIEVQRVCSSMCITSKCGIHYLSVFIGHIRMGNFHQIKIRKKVIYNSVKRGKWYGTIVLLLIIWLTDCLAICLSDWLTVWLINWLTNCLTDYLTVCLIDCLTVWQTVSLSDYLTDSLSICLTDWLTDGLSTWISDCGWLSH